KNKMLQRIYGISFDKKKNLDEYLEMLEEAKKRDHRKLGKELDLFSMHEEGPGFPFFHPKGMIVRNELENFWKAEHEKRGYGEIKTPVILSESLWHQSGHWDHYQENMYFTKIDDQDYAIKPMNCPGGILVYKSNMHSYKELPLKYAELGLVHRHELSGTLHGLMRVRSFTQDDAHIFMLQSQIKEEIKKVIDLCDYIYSVFGFKYTVELSTRPEDFMGEVSDWDYAIQSLKEALEEKGIDYEINEGDGAFYGPKIDYHLEDAIGRTWQCGTIQLDFQMPERFDLTFIDSDGEKKRPVMVHRAILGSMERFMGILIEHFAGKFPAWLAPVQVEILPISDKFNDYAKDLAEKMKSKGIRAEVDDRSEKIGFKIREAQMNKIPYSLIIGEKEIEENKVSVRKRDEGDKGSVSQDEFIASLLEEIEEKRI
ncbi:MAG: threonine--tRNA ligase, partial [Tissierellia bacterium]|nr:threonine--tRNA ligase [Tissierellia bacterium]